MRLTLLFIFIQLSFIIFAQPTITFDTLISGLNNPMQVTHAGDGSNRIFVAQKNGIIRVFDNNYASLGTFLTVTNVNSSASEEGLLSLVFHPEYYSNGFFWVFYTNSNSNLEIARYKVSSGNANVADAASKQIVKTILHSGQTNHNGGEMHFGNDGYLYLSTGDGGGGGDPFNKSQNIDSLLGKVLRLDVSLGNTAPFYTVPASNPFGNEVYVLGLRNPFRWEFDRHTKDMWIGDVGQNSWEEINYLPANAISGKNMGWKCYEGNAQYDNTGCNSNYTFPVYAYAIGVSKSNIGGTVYRGYEFPSLKGYYIGVDYFSGNVYRIIYNNNTNQWVTAVQTTGGKTSLSDISESESGELLATRNSGSNGQILKIKSTPMVNVTYVFTGNGNWTVATNWKGNLIPPNPLPSGSQIVIKPRKNGVCNLNQIQVINEGADLFIEPGSNFEVNSNLTIND